MKKENVLKNKFADIIQNELLAYQIIDNKKKEIKCNFILENNILKFDITDNYDKSKELVIDPIVYCTYFGGSEYESPEPKIKYAKDGKLILTSNTSAKNFPTTPGALYQNSDPDAAATISKFDYLSGNLLYSTIFYNHYRIMDLESDELGNLYLQANTNSDSLFTTNGSKDSCNLAYRHFHFTILNPELDSIIYASYVCAEVVTQISYYKNKIYFCGITINEINYPRGEMFQEYIAGERDYFFVSFDINTRKFSLLTYLGGSDNDNPGGSSSYLKTFKIKNDKIYIVGKTRSKDFPITENALFKEFDSYSKTFFSVLSLDGSELLYSSFIKKTSKSSDAPVVLDFKSNGNPVIFGHTTKNNFEETDGVADFDFDLENYDENYEDPAGLYITELDKDTYKPLRSCFMEICICTEYDAACFMIDNNNDDLHFVFTTIETKFPVSPGGVNHGFFYSDALYFIIDKNFSRLKYSTYFGGKDIRVYSIDLNNEGFPES